MSWNKNTRVESSVDATIEVLKKLSVPYTVTVLGTVIGMGLNDYDDKRYDIRRLQYRDTVLLEAMYRTEDCDSDDYLISYDFTLDTEPKAWKIEEQESSSDEPLEASLEDALENFLKDS